MNDLVVTDNPPKAPGKRWLWGLLAALVIGVLAGLAIVAAIPRSGRAMSQKAIKAVDERRFADARIVLDQWLKSDPSSGEAQYLLARVELAEDHPQLAMNALGKALDRGYPADKLAPYRAVILANGDQFDEAEPVLRKALADYPDERMPEVARALARIYLSTFRLPKAAEPITRWMRDDPDNPTPYLWQNDIEMRSDANHAVMIQNFREALKRDPKLAKAQYGLADRLLQAHQLEEAAEVFDQYIKTNPDDPEGHLGAGRVFLELGQRAEAAKEFDRVIELNPKDSIALKERGVIDLQLGKLATARDFFERALKIDPFDPEAHYNYSLVLQKLGKVDEAKKEAALNTKLTKEHARLADLRAALVKKPKDLGLRFEVAQWMLDHGRDAEGVMWSDQILHDAPGYQPMVRVLVDHFAKKDPGKANYYRMMLK